MSDSESDTAGRFPRIAGPATLAGIVLLSGINGALLDTGAGNFPEFLGGALLGGAAAAIAFGLVLLFQRLFARLPAPLGVSMAAAALAAWWLVGWSPAEVLRTLLDPSSWSSPVGLPTGLDPASIFVLALAIGLVAGLAASGVRGELAVMPRRRRHVAVGVTAVVTVLALAVVVELVRDGADPYPTDFSTFAFPGEASATTLANPASPGGFEVRAMSYGAGENPRRPAFGADRDLESRTVDATSLLPEWKGFKARMRESYWGFGLEDAPLNGLVWAPRGEGPFPLVLIVHGNHGMEDYSDPGYAYLAELLASRGYIAVSVDQNYINGSWSGDFRGKEMPIRAWLLLEHLALWRDWNDSPGHPFGGRVDMERISLVGHSRGGEAVSIAYAFNGLPRYPDDATVPFDYGFSILSLVAIAQVDQRYHRRVELENVSFLALQGSYDSDEPAFHGLRQYHRIALTGPEYRFKAGLYVHGANHGQFNSTWGRYDYGAPEAWLLNTAPIIPAEDQRAVASAYVSAFLDATLKGDAASVALFRDPRAGAEWLPDHPYVQQFSDSTFRPLATFEEDLDVATGSPDGVRISAEGFRVWREEALRHRDERLQGSNAVVLGWRAGDAPRYTISVPPSFWDDSVSRDDLLTLSITASTEKTPSEDDEPDGDAPGDDDPAAPRVTVEGIGVDGRLGGIDSAAIAPLAPPLRVQYLKNRAGNDEVYNAAWEPVLQVLEVPLSLLDGGTGVSNIAAIRLRFDGTDDGMVIVDDIGLRRSRPQGSGE